MGTESFTTIGPHWNDELWHDQKPAFDHEVCARLNCVYLHTFTCSPDFSLTDVPNQADFEYIHYRNGSSLLYFVSNQTAERRTIYAHFHVNGLQPELWDAVTGEIEEAKAFEQQPSGTTVPLTLEPYASIFVVFQRPITIQVAIKP